MELGWWKPSAARQAMLASARGRASGHVCRVNRPNIRLLLTMYKSQNRTCKKGAIQTGQSDQFVTSLAALNGLRMADLNYPNRLKIKMTTFIHRNNEIRRILRRRTMVSTACPRHELRSVRTTNFLLRSGRPRLVYQTAIPIHYHPCHTVR